MYRTRATKRERLKLGKLKVADINESFNKNRWRAFGGFERKNTSSYWIVVAWLQSSNYFINVDIERSNGINNNDNNLLHYLLLLHILITCEETRSHKGAGCRCSIYRPYIRLSDTAVFKLSISLTNDRSAVLLWRGERSRIKTMCTLRYDLGTQLPRWGRRSLLPSKALVQALKTLRF